MSDDNKFSEDDEDPDRIKRYGGYEFGETLGQGSFGKVKLATNIRTKEKVREICKMRMHVPIDCSLCCVVQRRERG